MIELGRSSVQTWECDTMGHMNVQFYVERAADAMASLCMRLGLGPNALRQKHRKIEILDQHVRFLRELRPGTPYFLRGGIVEANAMQLTAYCELVQTANGEPAAAMRQVLALRQIENGKFDEFDEAVRGRTLQLRTEIPVHGVSRGLVLDPPRTTPALGDAERLKLLPTHEGVVKRQECDAHGHMHPRFFMGRLSDAIPNLLVLTSGRNRGEPGSVGGAALEYRFIYRSYPRAGDLLGIRSGLRSIAEKTYIWGHWVFDLETGACIATAEAVAVAMDLVTRKAIAIPAELRVRLEALVVPGLTV